MRYTLFTIAFLACAPETDELTLNEAALTAGPTVSFAFPFDGAKVGLRAVRYDSEGEVIFVGTTLRAGTVVDGVATITLPERPAKRDKNAENPVERVSYHAFAYGDFPVEADDYYGVSSDSVTYFSGRGSGGRSGWYVQSIDETGNASWASTDKVVDVPASLMTKMGATVAGERGQMPQGTAFRIGFESEEGMVDSSAAMDLTFSATIEGSPTSTYELPDGTDYAELTPVVYDDVDGDEVYGGDDKIVGEICWQTAPIRLQWLEAPHSAEQAINMQRTGTSIGWTVMGDGIDASFQVPGDAVLSANEACPTTLPNADEGIDGQP